MNFGDLTKWVQLKPQQLLAISLVSGLLLFLPDHTLKRIGIESFRDQFRPWIGIAFLVFSSLLVSQILFTVGDWIQKRRATKTRKSEALKTLHNLTSAEKKILGFYIGRGTKTQFLSADGIVGGLCSKRILYQSSQFGKGGWGDAPDFFFNISDWAWDYLKEHPELVEPDIASQ